MKKVSILLAALLGTATVAEAQLAAGYGFTRFVAPADMVAELLKMENYTQVLAPDATIETPFEYIFADGTLATSKWGGTEGKAFEIGFDFPFAGETMKYFVPSVGGVLKLGATEQISAIANSYFFTNYNEAYDNTVFFANDGGIKATTGLEIGYTIIGEAPARMLVVGYKQYGLDDTGTDAVNIAIGLMENGDIVYGINGTPQLANSYSWIAGVRGSGPEDNTCVGGDFDTVSRTYGASSTVSSSVVDNTALYFTYPTDVVTPGAQPTDFEVTGATATTISGKFTPAINADYSLVVVSEGALDANPEAQKTYEKGDAIGNGIVVDYTKDNTFNAYDLKGTTEYTFTIFASNKYGFNGPQYNTVEPLVGTASTTPGKPGPLSIYDITKESFTLDVAADEAGDQVFVVISDTTHNPGNYGVRAYHGEISDAYKTGDEIEGGGKVAYFGPATTGFKLEGLEASKEYYFLAYSYSEQYGFSSEPDTVMAKAITIIELPWAYTTGANSLYDVPTGWDSNLTISEANSYGTLVPTDASGYELGGRYIEGKNYAKVAPMHINQSEAVFSFDFAAFTWSRFAQPPYNAYSWKEADKLYAVIHSEEGEETVPLLDGESFVEPDSLALTTFNVDLSNYVDKVVEVEVVFEVNAYDVYVVMENFKAEGKDIPVNIRGINSEAIEGKSFDLQGRRASEATGLIIKKGKVILVK